MSVPGFVCNIRIIQVVFERTYELKLIRGLRILRRCPFPVVVSVTNVANRKPIRTPCFLKDLFVHSLKLNRTVVWVERCYAVLHLVLKEVPRTFVRAKVVHYKDVE